MQQRKNRDWIARLHRPYARAERIARDRALGLLVLLVGISAGGMAHANAGRTPGTYSVSAEGAATYTIPIWAPNGPNGLEPHLALTYNSQSGKGYVGVGWALSGLSAITRCDKTFAQDGQASPVQLQASDGYCLDGQRLRLVSGAYSGRSCSRFPAHRERGFQRNVNTDSGLIVNDFRHALEC